MHYGCMYYFFSLENLGISKSFFQSQDDCVILADWTAILHSSLDFALSSLIEVPTCEEGDLQLCLLVILC